MDTMSDVELRMSGGQSFTYAQLCAVRDGDDRDRAIDKTIQRWRRKGLIAFTREGGRVVWRLTDAGREHFGTAS